MQYGQRYAEVIRDKRSGSGTYDIFGAIKHKIAAGVKSKLTQLGKASASAAGSLAAKASHSSASGSGHADLIIHHPPVEHGHDIVR